MQLTKEQTAEILNALGYQIDRSYKFKIRDEHTPSASINPKDGKIKDFGSGWYGDIVDFLVEFHNYQQKDAFRKISSMLNLNTDNSFTNFKFYENIKKETSSMPHYISQSIIDNFQKERKENFSRFWELLSQTMPTANKEQKREIAKKYEIGYSKKADRLIMPIRNENGNCLTFWKYNPTPTPFIGSDGGVIQLPKVMFSKNRQRTLFDIKNLERFSKTNEPIFILEGEKDCLNALANGFNAITLGSATQNIDNKFLNYFKDKYVVIAYDFDESGKNGSKILEKDLKGITKKTEIIDWEKIAKKLGFTDKLKKGFDFTDYLKIISSNSKIIEKNIN